MAGRLVLAAVVIAACLATAGSAARAAEAGGLDKGHRVLIERGLQIHALAFVEDPLELKPLLQANFTGINFGWKSDMKKLGPPPGVIWSRWSAGGEKHETDLRPDEQPYLKNMVAWACADEENLNDAAMREKVAGWFKATRAGGKFENTILYTNQYGGQVTNENLSAYVASSKPDMLSFDTYPFLLDAPTGGSPTPFYGDSMRYRKHGLAAGVPYAMWIQTFHGENRYRDPSESEMRLNQFAAWTFGYKMITAFTWNSGATNLFKGPGDRNPTDAYRQIAKINRESLHLGPALVRLKSTDVRMIMGQRAKPGGAKGEIEDSPQPIDVQPWRFGENDPFIRGITAENLGPTNDKLRGDVVIGWFKPLEPAKHGDDTYFVITNGLCSPPNAPLGGSAAACRQRITVNLHFKETGMTRLLRLSRTTGKVEPVALKALPKDPGRHLLVFELDGGTGDLFKFDAGNSFVGSTLSRR